MIPASGSEATGSPPTSSRYHPAAIAYAVYGSVYLWGAIVGLTAERKVALAGTVPWWLWYVVGAALVLALPPLIWRGHKWLTRFLTLGVGVKALTLCWKIGRLMETGEPIAFAALFATVAIVTATLLGLASFGAKA